MTEAVMKPFIVIGVDGSEPSKDAVRWAAKQAELTGAELHAVTADLRLPRRLLRCRFRGASAKDARGGCSRNAGPNTAGAGDRPRDRGSSGSGAHRCVPVLRPACRRQPWTWGVHRNAPRVGQPAVCSARDLPGTRRTLVPPSHNRHIVVTLACAAQRREHGLR